MKNFLKEKEPAAPSGVVLSDLNVGCVVGFGFMPQRNISGKRLPITEINSYIFGDDSFVAYRLEGEGVDVNLIVAEGSGADTYLALSQPLAEHLLEPLFGPRDPQQWFEFSRGETVRVNLHAEGAPQGWLASSYRLIMVTEGRTLEGDFRMRGPAGRLNLSRPFEYALLVDDDNTHALEVERHEDGTMRIFATVYRPVTDIGEISRIALVKPAPLPPPPRAVPVSRMSPSVPDFRQPLKIEEDALPAVTHHQPVYHQPLKTEEDVLPAAHHHQPTHFQPLYLEPMHIEPVRPQHDPVDVLVEETRKQDVPAHSRSGRLQPAEPERQTFATSAFLACDTRLAGRIIDEAQRNQMLLSDLIRKVIDLPAQTQEQVLIPFTLSDGEYAELARRYHLSISDKEAVREQVIEELRAFVGDKR